MSESTYDLPRRLRDAAYLQEYAVNGVHWLGCLLNEAADEIERRKEQINFLGDKAEDLAYELGCLRERIKSDNFDDEVRDGR